MKKILLSLSLIISITIQLNAADFDIRVEHISVDKNAENYNIKTKLRCKTSIKNLFSDFPLYITSPELIIRGTVESNKIRETNVIFSEKNIDLNADNDFNDIYSFRTAGRRIYINNKEFYPVQSSNLYQKFRIRSYFDKNYSPINNSVTTGGRSFLVDSKSTKPLKLTLLFGESSKKVKILKIENPSLIITVLKPVFNTQKKPSFSFTGMKNRVYITNDFDIPGTDDMFAQAVWINIPLKVQNTSTLINRKLKGIKPPFLLKAFIDFSFENGTSLRTPEKSILLTR